MNARLYWEYRNQAKHHRGSNYMSQKIKKKNSDYLQVQVIILKKKKKYIYNRDVNIIGQIINLYLGRLSSGILPISEGEQILAYLPFQE